MSRVEEKFKAIQHTLLQLNESDVTTNLILVRICDALNYLPGCALSCASIMA